MKRLRYRVKLFLLNWIAVDMVIITNVKIDSYSFRKSTGLDISGVKNAYIKNLEINRSSIGVNISSIESIKFNDGRIYP